VARAVSITQELGIGEPEKQSIIQLERFQKMYGRPSLTNTFNGHIFYEWKFSQAVSGILRIPTSTDYAAGFELSAEDLNVDGAPVPRGGF
jgi:hypothetical protein